MKKGLYFIVLVFLLFSISSCKTAYKLTESEQEQIQEDWSKIHSNIISYEYLGRYNGFDILFCASVLTAIGTETIADYSFIHPTLFSIYAYQDHTFNELKAVYEEGKLENKHIQSIYSAYLSFMKKQYPAFYEGTYNKK